MKTVIMSAAYKCSVMKGNILLFSLAIYSFLVAIVYCKNIRFNDDDIVPEPKSKSLIKHRTLLKKHSFGKPCNDTKALIEQRESNNDDKIGADNNLNSNVEHNFLNSDCYDEKTGSEENCWLEVNVKKHFETMEALEEKYKTVRDEFQNVVESRNLNEELLKMMLETRAAAERAIYNYNEKPWKIPAGINLGGYGMMKLDDSMLFFHRMKLRNDTRFQVNYVSADVSEMVLTARLTLNDLRLFGQYERALSDKNALIYRPTFGELELLLKSVTYKMEGRLRLVQSRLVVEHVISDMLMKDLLFMYKTNGSRDSETAEKLPPAAISVYLERLKADLDSWLKDYFNDYLIYFALSDVGANKELHCYDKQKQMNLNDFMDHVIEKMRQKLYSLKPSAANIKTPAFSIFSINGVQIRLHSGVIRGFDSFHRQSVATGVLENNLRKIDAVIGFSKLQMEYKYLAKISGRTPPLTGVFVLTAEDLIAHLGVKLLKEPEAMELSIGYLRQIRTQTLVIEGAVGRMVGNFRHVLENEIIALMSNALLYHIKQLITLTRCEPALDGHEDEEELQKINYGPSGSGEELNVYGGSGKPNYGVEKNDSIELEIPGTDNSPPKKVHIKHYQKFELDESILPNKTQKLDKPLNYGVIKNDSIELELPGAGDKPPKKLHLNHVQQFNLNEINNITLKRKTKEREPALDGHEDGVGLQKINYGPSGSSEDLDVYGGSGKPKYGVEKNDSIELEIPGTDNSPPKKVHIKHQQRFVLDERILPNKTQKLDKPLNYGVIKNDSIELELPGAGDKPPKKLHLNHVQQFYLNENNNITLKRRTREHGTDIKKPNKVHINYAQHTNLHRKDKKRGEKKNQSNKNVRKDRIEEGSIKSKKAANLQKKTKKIKNRKGNK